MKYEEFKQNLEKIINGDFAARENLRLYFINHPPLVEDEQLDLLKTEAFEFFSSFSDKENFHAYDILGLMYECGWGIKQNFKEALKYYELGAEHGLAEVQNNIALMYQEEKGVEKNYETAEKWYRLAVAQGNVPAQNNFGTLFGEDGSKKNLIEAMKWYRLAAEKGLKEAQYNLAIQYRDQKKYPEAVKWLQLSANQNFAQAQASLGSMTFQGLGVPKNYNEAFKLYISSAKQSDEEGLEFLGQAYEFAIGCVKDVYKAIVCYVLAMELSTRDDSINRLNFLQKQGHQEAVAIAMKSNLVIPNYYKDRTQLALMGSKGFDHWISKLSWQVQQEAQKLTMDQMAGNLIRFTLEATITKQNEIQNLQDANAILQQTIKKLQLENAELQKKLEQSKLTTKNELTITELMTKRGNWSAPPDASSVSSNKPPEPEQVIKSQKGEEAEEVRDPNIPELI